MKCPDCAAKITAKHYDPTFEWYECPKCEGAFTYDEILEAKNEQVAKAGSRKHSVVSKRTGSGDRRPVPVAKGKKRQQEREDDEVLADEQVKAIVSKKVKNDEIDVKHHRDALPTGQVVNIMADEIQEIYHTLGSELDEMNARDKALVVWRDLMIHGHVSAREQAVPMALCGKHRG